MDDTGVAIERDGCESVIVSLFMALPGSEILCLFYLVWPGLLYSTSTRLAIHEHPVQQAHRTNPEYNPMKPKQDSASASPGPVQAACP